MTMYAYEVPATLIIVAASPEDAERKASELIQASFNAKTNTACKHFETSDAVVICKTL